MEQRRVPGDDVTMDQQALVAAGLAIVTFAAAVILGKAGRDAWPGAPYMSVGLVVLAAFEAAVAVAAIGGDARIEPGPLDALFLLAALPFARAARDEYRARLPGRAPAEAEADVVLISVSVAAVLYLVIRPVDASTAASLSAAIFAITAAVLASCFGGLALRAPEREHLALFALTTGMAFGLATLGHAWVRGSFDGFPALSAAALAVCPLLLVALVSLMRSREIDAAADRRSRVMAPILVNISVAVACLALGMVAFLDDARGIDGLESAVIIASLSLAIASRIVANQIASSSAQESVHRALDEKASALRETDVALGRVRDAADTLRASEEHLRLVFDTAVDGIVELSIDGRIVRANAAFGRLVGLEPAAVAGQPWSAIAATVDGPDDSFSALLESGNARIRGREGQAIHLESTVSEVPTTPPRRLLLVRDVSDAKVAEQTIRSLFQFLQDRDEDRSRLLRRTNTAIENERNRIARDLHDGPVQGVSAASLSLEAALLMFQAGETLAGFEVLSRIREELADEADALRRLMSGLRPPVLEERGLLPAIRDTIGRFDAEQGARAVLQGTIEHPLSPETETLAYRVVQEALTNAAKHASPSTVTVVVHSDPTQVQVEVSDDGVGFDPSHARDFLQAGRVGLASMRERVELAGGTFTVRSSAGRGTTIAASLPVDPAVVTRTVDRER